MRVSNATNSRNAVSWDRIPAAKDVEVYARLRHNVPRGSNRNLNWITVRGGGAASTETGRVSGLWWGEEFGNPIHARGFSLQNGVNTVLWEDLTNSGIVADEWFRSRVQVTGDTFRVKFWLDGGLEPAAWERTITNTDNNLPGWIGLGGFNAGEYDYDVFSVGTEGDPAPTVPVDEYRFRYDPYLFSAAELTGIPTLSAPGVIDITATSARPQVTLTY